MLQTSANVVCPYYKNHDEHEIRCMGIQRGCGLHCAFANVSVRRRWMLRYCNTFDYRQCILAAALERYYGGEDG